MKLEYVVDSIQITSNEELSNKEIKGYIAYARNQHPGRVLESINLEMDGDEVGISYCLAPEHFEKIRRITGYLVGDMSRWNDGKTAEEQDRVKHA